MKLAILKHKHTHKQLLYFSEYSMSHALTDSVLVEGI